ncbi:hypothetical protein HYZ41_03725 [archaeon]|nr:hypothetical protein [archaeon]
MGENEDDMVLINPLILDGRTVIDRFWIGKEVDYCSINPVESVNGMQNYRKLPTFRELFHAYRTNYSIKENIDRERSVDCKSTFFRDGILFERPERVFVNKKRKWCVDGGKQYKVGILPDGWVTEYDPETLWPSNIGHYKEAESRFGEDGAFYFFCKRLEPQSSYGGLRIVEFGYTNFPHHRKINACAPPYDYGTIARLWKPFKE